MCWALCNSLVCSTQAPLSTEFFKQDSWSGLPLPPPGDLPDPGIEPASPAALACRQILNPLTHWVCISTLKSLIHLQFLSIKVGSQLLFFFFFLQMSSKLLQHCFINTWSFWPLYHMLNLHIYLGQFLNSIFCCIFFPLWLFEAKTTLF